MSEERQRECASEMVRWTISSNERRELKASDQEGGEAYTP
jgi:hypothetical protein